MKKAGSGKVVTEKSDAIDSAEEYYEIKDELKTTGTKVRTVLTDNYEIICQVITYSEV